MSTQLVVRLDKKTKETFQKLVRNEGKSVSDVLRGMISEYVKERDISESFDELWNSIGRQMKDNGYKESDIPNLIKEVRTTKRNENSH